jgi:hypothetical protein
MPPYVTGAEDLAAVSAAMLAAVTASVVASAA